MPEITVSLNDFIFPSGVVIHNPWSFSPVKHATTILLDGALLAEESVLAGARPITIKTGRIGDGYCGLFTIPELDALRALYVQPSLPLTLTIGASSYGVLFDRENTGIEVNEIVNVAAGQRWPDDCKMYEVTARFLTTDSV